MNLYPKNQLNIGVWGVTATTQLDKGAMSVTVEFKVTKWKVYCWAVWQHIKERFKK